MTVAQLTSEKAVAEAYAGELKTALEEAYEYIEQLEEERCASYAILSQRVSCWDSVCHVPACSISVAVYVGHLFADHVVGGAVHSLNMAGIGLRYH